MPAAVNGSSMVGPMGMGGLTFVLLEAKLVKVEIWSGGNADVIVNQTDYDQHIFIEKVQIERDWSDNDKFRVRLRLTGINPADIQVGLQPAKWVLSWSEGAANFRCEIVPPLDEGEQLQTVREEEGNQLIISAPLYH